MPVLVALIIISFALYLFYKIKALRMKNRPNERRWVGTKASICLGALLIFFGLNELFLRQTTGVVILSIIFFLVGGYYVYQNIKLYRYLLPYAAEESRQHRLNDDQ
ncbi:MAG TPA: YtpI family protein [Bacillales bacterium]|nr:YtpI family protein [Bacillales bacterium]